MIAVKSIKKRTHTQVANIYNCDINLIPLILITTDTNIHMAIIAIWMDTPTSAALPEWKKSADTAGGFGSGTRKTPLSR